jgi:hypothetical protein
LVIVAVLVGLVGPALAPAATGERTPRCFGAPSRDPDKPCVNARLRTMVVPTPQAARSASNSPCREVEPVEPPFPCTFGAKPRPGRETIALIGDSHAIHWRGAVDQMARTKGWAGISLTSSGCPLTTAPLAQENRRNRCRRVVEEIVDWLGRHRGVTRVFVSDHGTRVVQEPGEDAAQAMVRGFRGAWRRLPPWIHEIAVIRDAPWSSGSVAGCVEQAMARRADAGQACALPRSRALRRDPQFEAVAGFTERRVLGLDLTHVMCDETRCFPVIGGALVHKDLGHLTAVFAATMGPQLLRALRRAEHDLR